MSQVNINLNTNQVEINTTNNQISVTNPDNPTVVNITQPVTSVVEVITAGPQGPVGSPGDPSILTGSFITTSSFNAYTGSSTSQFFGTSSYAITASYLEGYISPFPFTGSAIITGSLEIIGNQTINGDLTVNGTASISYLNVTIESASVIYSSGSNVFGDASDDTQTLIGTVIVSGSQQITGSLNAPSITGSLFGTASFAVSASRAISSSYSNYATTASSATNAEDILVYVKNVTGAQINKGTVVRISGATGDNPLISTASYESDSVSANTLGITNQNIPHDSFGYVMTEGKLIGINTNGFTAGQLIYLGPTGSIIGTAPTAPLHNVRLGEVLRVQQNNGSIYVRIDNGYELGELHDVIDTTTTSSYGDLLVKSGSVWINSKQLTGSYGLTGSLLTTGSLTVQGPTTLHSGQTTVRGSGATSSTTALRVENSNASASLVVLDNGNTGIGTTNPTTSFHVSGSTLLQGGQTTVQGSGSAQPLFLVSGSTGELISIVDSNTGSLLQIYNSSSNSVFQVNNNAEIIYGVSSSILATQYSTISATGSYQTIYNIQTGSYTGAFINYTITSASNARAGQLMSVWNSGTASYTEVTTTDIGNTSQVAFDVIMTGSLARIAVSSSLTTGWQVKTALNIL